MKPAVNQGENNRLRPSAHTVSAAERTLLHRDESVFFHQTLSTPVNHTVAKASGAYIYDLEGRAYLDLHGNGVHTIGYQHPNVLTAIKAQMEADFTFAPRRFTNEPAVALAEKLVSIVPDGLTRVLFCPGGSEAIEMAIMLAKQVTGRWKTLSYAGTFHGAGFQAVSVGADPHFRDGIGPIMPGAIHLEMPDYYRNPWGLTDLRQVDDLYLAQVREALSQNPDVAALISEPIFYNSTVPTPYFWQQVRAMCDEYGVLLIFDEIYTAFGRTGRMFASEHFVTPDILVVGKGFGGGVLPFAGIIGKEALNCIPHTSIGHYTHEKNPLCSAVSLAMIQTVEQEGLVQKAETLGRYCRQGLLQLQQEFEWVGEVTGLGLNLGLDLVTDRVSKARHTELAHFIMEFAWERGISFKLIQGNILNLKPALIITREEIDRVVEVIRQGLGRFRS